MFSIHCQDVSWVILLISCWFVGRSRNAAVNWFSMFKCREQQWGPGPQSAQWPTLCSERSHETSLSIIGHSISTNRPVDTMEIRRGQSIAGCCHLLARRHMRKFIWWKKYHTCCFTLNDLFCSLNNHGSLPVRQMLHHFQPCNIFRQNVYLL